MATRSWTAEAVGADDFELGIARTTPVKYHCTAPEDGKADGLVFVIPDFNDDADGDDFCELRQHLANQYHLLAVSVEYHCYRSRIKDGARIDLSDDEFSELSRICMQKGVALIDRNALMYALNQLNKPYEIQFRVVPENGEYQNFGLMQALDHLAVLRHIVVESHGQLFDRANIIALGAGYAGYLAQMLAKLAPNTLRAVIECSAYVTPPESYLFGDGALGSPPYYYHVGSIRIAPLLFTRWLMNPESSAYYSQDRREVRSLSHVGHLTAMAMLAKRRCQYRHVAVLLEGREGFVAKQEFVSALSALGFDAKLVRDHDHALLRLAQENKGCWGKGLRAMFDSQYPALPPNHGLPDWEMDTSVGYLCSASIYGFEHGVWGCSPDCTPI